MRYSFIMPFFNRPNQLWNTLVSFRHWYGNRNDVEYIIVEDAANIQNPIQHQNLVDVLYAFGDLNWVHLFSSFKNQYNPVRHRNQAANAAKGSVLVQTNPECWHKVDILSAVDESMVKRGMSIPGIPEKFGPEHPQWNIPSYQNKYKKSIEANSFTINGYLVCACENSEVSVNRPELFETMLSKTKFKSWYQHSKNNNRCLHWCSFISKENYTKIGGFDEKYGDFCGYDDDDFRETVKNAGIPIITRDDLMVVHGEHDTTHHTFNIKPLETAGRDYFRNKWPHMNIPDAFR